MPGVGLAVGMTNQNPKAIAAATCKPTENAQHGDASINRRTFSRMRRSMVGGVCS